MKMARLRSAGRLLLVMAGILAPVLITTGCVSSPATVGDNLNQGFRPLTLPPPRPEPPEPITYGEISGPALELAKEVGACLREEPGLNRIAVTTFVDVNNLDRTSAFGRALTDALISLLHRQGFNVVEMRKTSNLLIEKGKGEFSLSREITHLATQQEISAVLVGTYTEGFNLVLISTRLVAASDGQVLSAGLLELPKSRNLAYLLGGLAGPAGSFAQSYNLNRAPAIPAAEVPVLERRSKGPAKVKP